MTSFGWKRKRQLSSNAAVIFTKREEEVGDDEEDDSVDWLTLAKRKRGLLLEDGQAKSKRLQNEGAFLAEHERYWEAIKYWDEALELNPRSAVLYEMKSQVLQELKEVFPAVEAAEKAVNLEPTWSVAWQTLGRAQIGMGELDMALLSAQKSLHLDPTSEVREDIKWIQELLKQKATMAEKIQAEEEETRKSILETRANLSDTEQTKHKRL